MECGVVRGDGGVGVMEVVYGWWYCGVGGVIGNAVLVVLAVLLVERC